MHLYKWLNEFYALHAISAPILCSRYILCSCTLAHQSELNAVRGDESKWSDRELQPDSYSI